MFINKNFKIKSIWTKIHIDPIFLFIILIILTYSIIIMWSASSQNINIMEHKCFQIFVGLVIMIIMAQIPPRIYEHCSAFLYFLCLVLLIIVNFFGYVSKGAQRWLDLGVLRFQPSELAKIAVPLMLARFINRNIFPLNPQKNIVALIIIFIPVFFVANQPDLGTALLIALSGFFILFLSGMHWKFIGAICLILMIFIPILWCGVMHDYQRNRIIVLLNPEKDPLGSGYHIIQSKIAIGSGGLYGKGLLHGTQSQLDFLPERHTDFIFAVIGEELGQIGVLVLIILYLSLIIRGLSIATKAQTTFGRVITGGFMLILFIYIFINIGMVSGLVPVVGIPLPLISYGGSALTVLMAGFGIIMSIHTHRKMLSKNI